MGIIDSPAKALASGRDFLRATLGVDLRSPVPKADFPEGFIIQEYIEGKPAERLALTGNLMPVVPFSFGGSQRINKTYYAGNSEASMQILGAEEDNVTIEGVFKDKRYKDTSLRGVSFEIAQMVEALRIRGNLVEITLGEWRRFGFIEKATFEMKDLKFLKYRIEFSIASFTKPNRCIVLDRTKEVPFAVNAELVASALAFQNTYSVFPAEMTPSLADSIRNIVSDVATVIAGVTNYIDGTLAEIDDVKNALTRARGLIDYTIYKVRDYRKQLGELGLGFAALGSPTVSRYVSAIFIQEAITETHTLTDYLFQLKQRFAQLSASIPLARHLVVEGDTLQKLAFKFYNDSSLWEKIYEHNALSSTQLTVGAVIEIPR